jgi:hypothetical protein
MGLGGGHDAPLQTPHMGGYVENALARHLPHQVFFQGGLLRVSVVFIGGGVAVRTPSGIQQYVFWTYPFKQSRSLFNVGLVVKEKVMREEVIAVDYLTLFLFCPPYAGLLMLVTAVHQMSVDGNDADFADSNTARRVRRLWRYCRWGLGGWTFRQATAAVVVALQSTFD